MKQIIALGGGGFSMESENPLLDQYILSQTGKKDQKSVLSQRRVEIRKIIFLDFIISLKNSLVCLHTYHYLNRLQGI